MRKTENIINRTGINKTECKKTGHSKENKIPGVKCTPKIELYLSNFKGALHWWNGSLFFLIIILGITLGIFAGCKNIFVPEPPATPEAAGPGGGITVSLRLFTGSARSVMPGMEDLTWEITASQGDITISVAEGAYPEFSLSLPVSGTWTFTVRGINSVNNDEIFTGSAEQNIESGSTVSISIPLSPGSGMGGDGATGTLSLPIELINVCNMNLTYRINDGEWVEVFEFGGSGKVSIFKKDLPVGPHTLDLYFSSNSDKGEFYFCTVAVNIWPGMTSDQWIKTNGEEYITDGGEFVINEGMVDKFVKNMGSVVFVDASVDANTPGTGSIYAPVNSVSTAVEILRKADPNGKCNGTIMVSGATTIDQEIKVENGETLTVKGTESGASITNTSGRVFNIAPGGSLTLEENITLTGKNDAGNGGAVYVNGGTFTMKARSKITGSSASYGGGVYVDSNGIFTMDGGAITENSANSYDAGGNGKSGGGVYVNGGKFEMTGTATLQGNEAAEYGGGVYVYAGNFIMEGGTIGGPEAGSANFAQYGGGVYVNGGKFEMTGTATLQGNEAAVHGGGVHILSGGIFTMNGGTIGGTAQNTAQFGGGVFVSGGTFDMNNGTISGNTVTESGGGVYVNDGNFTMAGGTIGGTTPNIATYGGGVHVFGGTFTVSGSSLTITGNTAHNVYLASGNTITIGDGDLTGCTIGVSAEDMVSNDATPITNKDVTGADGIFSSDNPDYSIAGYNKAVYLSDAETAYNAGSENFGTFEAALDAVNKSADGGTITLLKNIVASNAVFGASSDDIHPITFTGGTKDNPITLDLNGKTIDRGLRTAAALSDGSVIKIEGGTLKIKDSSAALDGTSETGTITGGNTKGAGGGIHITSNSMGTVFGSLILESGSISGNTADGSNGGGVYIDNNCAFTMEGGSIDGNTVSSASNHGGGVFVYGTFTMENGIITKNSSEQGNGGGVNIGSNGTFTMKNGIITKNRSEQGNGGGVNIGSNGTFTMIDGTISDNDAGMTGGGVNLGASSSTMTLEDGTISGNTATMNGGGVGVSEGIFTMNGGTLSGNTATSGNGGGVYVDGTNSIFFMHGNGTITNNTAKLGGGVYVSNSGSFEIGTSSEISPVISGNTKTDNPPNNVYLDTGKTLFITGELKKSKEPGNIGISMATLGVFTSGWSTSGSTEPTFFFSDDTKRNVALSGSELSLNLVRVKGGSCILNGQNVTLSSFWISPYEVTQAEFESVMEENANDINPDFYHQDGTLESGEDQKRRPADRVRWYEAIVYCNLLSIKEDLTPCYTINDNTDPAAWGVRPDSGVHVNYNAWNSVTCNFEANGYRLPTEAEWEYAARGGDPESVGGSWDNIYSGSDTINDVAWYDGNSESKTHEVGRKQANALGLYDMSGNVREWCWNRKSEDNDSRVMRGGYYSSAEGDCQVTAFDSNLPISQGPDQGFRVVRSIR